jgi:hypothetical protein
MLMHEGDDLRRKSKVPGCDIENVRERPSV